MKISSGCRRPSKTKLPRCRFKKSTLKTCSTFLDKHATSSTSKNKSLSSYSKNCTSTRNASVSSAKSRITINSIDKYRSLKKSKSSTTVWRTLLRNSCFSSVETKKSSSQTTTTVSNPASSLSCVLAKFFHARTSNSIRNFSTTCQLIPMTPSSLQAKYSVILC